jgi:RHH-type proline utilization regulon transcriptional repressor/proline dehydrogenase/delta 1-pyrroline-5-carboxylate dehydrogenase
MIRMLSSRPDDVMLRALSDADPGNPGRRTDAASASSASLARWAIATGRPELAACCQHFAALSGAGCSRTLTGPTGERNVYSLVPREAVLCLAATDADRLTQLAAVLAVGSTAVWPKDADADRLLAMLPAETRQFVVTAHDWTSSKVSFDAALHHGTEADLARVLTLLAQGDGPIVGLRALAPGQVDVPLEALVIERAVSTNTAAAGGNAGLMTIG